MSSLSPSGIKNIHLALCIAIAAVALLTTLLALGGGIPQAQTQETLTITGRVINGTEGATPPEGVAVLLLVSGADSGLIATDQNPTTPDGHFEFQDVPAIGDASYAFSVEYAQVFYGASLSLDDLSGEIQLTVYETTEDASVVRVTNQVMVIADIDEKNQTISAIEFVRLSNSSDRTLLPDLNNMGQLSFLRFALPPLAQELDVGSDMPGGDIIPIGTGFALTSPVVPGDHFVDFSFSFPYEGDELSYRQSLPQGADVYRLMVPVRLSTVGTDSLQAVDSIEQEGNSYRAWESTDFQPGQGLSLRLTGLPKPSFGARLEKSLSSANFWKVAIPIAMGAVLAFLLLFGTLKPRWQAQTPLATSSTGPNQAPVDRESAIQEIAALDERFQEGDLAEDAYLAERETLVARALGHSDPSEQGREPPQRDREVPTDE